ncbi:MAG: C40 family peptidase [Gemmatimonadota bacterium]
MRHLRLLALAIVLFLVPGRLSAQSVIFELGRIFSSPDWTLYQVGFGQPLSGPLGYTFYGVHAGETGAATGSLWGPGADLTLFRGGQPGPYLAAGLSGGLATGDGERFWGSWSAGLGYELRPTGLISLGAEGRWREIQYAQHQSGVEFALRLGFEFGRTGGRPDRPVPVAPGPATPAAATTPSLRTTVERSGIPGDRIDLVASVLQTATDAMGTPYKWGGTGAQDGGFDCSGLIQYAYGQHGITLPRRSGDQATQGEKIDKKLDALLPGDILTFSSSGRGRITHVGLYLGDGRFIHSANDGVQISLLSADDVYGRWWWRRWVGARRIT